MSKQKISSEETNQSLEDEEDFGPLWRDFLLTEELDGKRFDVALARIFPEVSSRSVAAKLIDADHALLNRKRAKCSEKTRRGDLISLNLRVLESPDCNPSPEDIALDILFEDEVMIVINKPAGMVVHPGAGVRSGTLVNAVLSHCGKGLPSLGGTARAGIVHRLDKETSGVMVVAKTLKALTSLSAQFARHEQTRRYCAIVNGVPSPEAGAITTWHGRDPRHRIRFAVLSEGSGKEARMTYETLEKFSNICSLQSCLLLTGRTHQIRVQMRHIGCALLGDSLYGVSTPRLKSEREIWAQVERLLTRQMLHAELLQLSHPESGERQTFTAPPPADFKLVLNLLRGHFARDAIQDPPPKF